MLKARVSHSLTDWKSDMSVVHIFKRCLGGILHSSPGILIKTPLTVECVGTFTQHKASVLYEPSGLNSLLIQTHPSAISGLAAWQCV